MTTPARTTECGHCPHCGAAVEGPDDAYCCTGCEAAAAIIRGAGLERWYTERDAYAPRPEPLTGAWSTAPVVQQPDGSREIRLTVDGLRCASCVWLIEAVLERTPGVEDVAVSYATGRAVVRWDPSRLDLQTIAERIAALGYRPRALGMEPRADRGLLARLGVTAFLAANLMGVYEALYAGWWKGMEPQWLALFSWVALALATPVALWGAQPFLAGAIQGLRHRRLHMDLPIAIGVATLYVHGIVSTLRLEETYLDSLGMLVTLLLGGRVLEARGRRRAAEAALSLAAGAPRAARRRRGDRIEAVPVGTLERGDLVEVAAGEELAADGTVVSGAGQVRVALITGESAPVPVSSGDSVVAGTVLVDGAITMRVDATGSDTVLHAMARQLEEAASREPRATAADRIAPWFTLATLVVAALTFAGWALWSTVAQAVACTVAVLVVACPCALALSQPLAGAAGLGAAARRGLLMRSSDALLELADVTLVAMDKTGTVTEGSLAVLHADAAVLRVAAGLERQSAHPIARSIVAEAARRHVPLPIATNVIEEIGVGVRGTVDGRTWRLRSGGPGEVELSDAEGVAGRILLGDAVREDAAATIRALRDDGLETTLLTGDHPAPARAIGDSLGVDRVVSRIDPKGKAAWIAGRRAVGERVLFVGDGLNDGPALAASDVGIAMGSGAASSVLVADGVVAAPALAPLMAGRRAARVAKHAITANQRRSIVYNVVSVALAAAGYVGPLVAAVLMPISSLVVIWGASRVETRVRREET